MIKTLIIGNSHTIALRSALDASPSIMESVDFYFIPGYWGTLAKSSVVNTPAIDASDHGICFSDFDRIVVSALGWWAARNQIIEGGHHPLARMTCADWGSSHCLPPGIELVSKDVFNLAVEGWIVEQPIVRLASHLSTYYSGRLILQPWPAPNRALAADSTWILNRWYGNQGASCWFDYWRAQHTAVVKISKAIAPNAKLLGYPLPGPGYDGFMDQHWCDPDPYHGNQNYGELVVNQILELE